MKGQVCDFGSGSLLQACSWTVPNGSHPTIRWRTAQGAQEFWLGGPGRDHTLSDTSGGYAYFETSYQSTQLMPYNEHKPNNIAANVSAQPITPYGRNNKNTEVIRPLLTRFPLFQLSAESSPEIVVPDYSLFQSPNITDTGPQGLCMSFFYAVDGLSAAGLQVILSDSKTHHNRTLISYNDLTEGEWRKTEIAYTYPYTHKVTHIN